VFEGDATFLVSHDRRFLDNVVDQHSSLDALPERMAALEAEQHAINARLADGKLYASDPALATQLAQRHAAIDDELLAALERQEALS
jgi:ABC transport system ATP-binding/permease protein